MPDRKSLASIPVTILNAVTGKSRLLTAQRLISELRRLGLSARIATPGRQPTIYFSGLWRYHNRTIIFEDEAVTVVSAGDPLRLRAANKPALRKLLRDIKTSANLGPRMLITSD
jgi:hypothetical protein